MKGKFFKENSSGEVFEIISYPVLNSGGEFVVFVRNRQDKAVKQHKMDDISAIHDSYTELIDRPSSTQAVVR